MKELIVTVPPNLTVSQVTSFFFDLDVEPEADNYVFDFKNLSWTPPFGMIYFGALFRQFRKRFPESVFQAMNHERHKYQAHMGFFKNFGLDYGKAPGEAGGNSRYVPITVLDIDTLDADGARQGGVFQDAVESHSYEISRVLAHEEKGALVDSLAYSFREILRNALEHSGSGRVGYCAQYWPTKHRAELAIVDAGCGVRCALSKNPFVDLRDDRDAILTAMLPGISGKFYKGVKKRNYDVWQNSGFGLFMTSRLCGNGGSFLMISGTKGVKLEPSHSRWFDANLDGTAIRAILKTDNLGPLTDSLATLNEEGRKMAREMGLDTRISASRASRMLARDFGE